MGGAPMRNGALRRDIEEGHRRDKCLDLAWLGRHHGAVAAGLAPWVFVWDPCGTSGPAGGVVGMARVGGGAQLAICTRCMFL